MDAFIALVAEKNFVTITVKSLVTQVNITRGPFHLYFSDIYKLVADMKDPLLSDMSEIPPDARPQRAPAVLPALEE